MNSLLSWMTATFGGILTKEALAFVISMVPILELRGGLIFASAAGIDMWKAIPICVIGNLIPVPFILLLITPVFNWLKKMKTFRPMVEKLENKAMSKKGKIEKYKFWGLVLFVGIPLPGTGAWTGSLIAALLDMDFKRAFPAVVSGICMATVIMTTLSYVIPGIFF